MITLFPSPSSKAQVRTMRSANWAEVPGPVSPTCSGPALLSSLIAALYLTQDGLPATLSHWHHLFLSPKATSSRSPSCGLHHQKPLLLVTAHCCHILLSPSQT